MKICHTRAQLDDALAPFRRAGESVALVPTMGNLHEGHLSLLREARQQADRIMVTIYVNPTQFGANEDFAAYPRTINADLEKLRHCACDLVWLPSSEEMYPNGVEQACRIDVPGVSKPLCGASRPAHFAGVASVVMRLILHTKPHVAVFGEKDWQQLLVICNMVRDFSLPVAILSAPILREPDGLAMSSRNGLLPADDRARAAGLNMSMERVRKALNEKNSSVDECLLAGRQSITGAGFKLDYLELRQGRDLSPTSRLDEDSRLFVAAWLGEVRLIDNKSVA